MTWTYTLATLSTSEKDQIRLQIGDTDTQAQLLQDEEINFAITQERNFWGAAARCAEMAGFLFLRKVDTKLGREMQVTYSTTAQQYFQMAKWLRAKSLAAGIAPYVGGLFVSDKNTISQDTSQVAPLFTKTMMQNPWTGGYETNSLPPTSGGNDATPTFNEDV